MEDRLTELEAAVDTLRQSLAHSTVAEPPPPPQGDYWVLKGLLERSAGQGAAVIFAGFTDQKGPIVGPVQWQYERTGTAIMDRDWADAASALDALGHPVRMRILQLIVSGVTATAELVADQGLGTTGQLHHHLKALMAGGWLRSPSRGHYEVVPSRLVPLLVAVTATEAS